MCSNIADTLECYMDDLIDCFESFVKKSLIIMTVAIGAIIAMFLYALRVVTERQNTSPELQENQDSNLPVAETQRSSTALKTEIIQNVEVSSLEKGSQLSIKEERVSEQSSTEIRRSSLTLKSKNDQNMESSLIQKDYTENSSLQYSKSVNDISTTGVNTAPMPEGSSNEEGVLRDIGLADCSEICNLTKPSLPKCSGIRIAIPSLPTQNQCPASSNPCMKHKTAKSSCCSMCCDDDK